jgi:3',5'-cyclic-AMP phosphodiesterase
MRMLHLSDTHIRRTDGPNPVGVDPRASLGQMLDGCREVRHLDVIVVTGDVADDGSREAYEHIRDVIGDFARERHIPVMFAIGNHDERRAFAEVLGNGHFDAAGGEPDQASALTGSDERVAMSLVSGYRIITLDSLVPGKIYGWLSRGQLDWLRETLAEPAPNGTVLALHHPPIALDVEVQQLLGLGNGTDLAEAIRGTDVQLVLCGHFHLQLSGYLAGVPVWVTPGVVNRTDLTATPGTERVVKGASATVVDLGGPTSPLLHLLHARDPQAGETVYEYGAEELSALLARSAPAVGDQHVLHTGR